MHAPRFLAVLAMLAACLLLQACSDSEDTGAEEAAEAPETAADMPKEPAPDAPPAEPAPEPVDACALLTAQEVKEAIGHAMDGPDAGPPAGGGEGEGNMSSCSFASRSESENAAPAELLAALNATWFVNVSVWVWPGDGEGARNYINAMRDAPMTDDPVQEVEGLGDEAVWNGTLHARKNKVTVSLDVRPPKEAENPGQLEMERALMEQALERL
ncbi:MAG: DUF3558 family protein [Alphaproteobacteria bacterium]